MLGLCYAMRMDTAQRFWAKVDIGAENECWLWLGSPKARYGVFSLGTSEGSAGAHRIAYEFLRGPIAPGLTIDHLCRVPRCVNPWHMEPVTQGENNRRRHDLACRNGHIRTPANTYVYDGIRMCRDCRRGQDHRRQAVKTAAVLHKRETRERCFQGHPWTLENVYVDPKGHRFCRICAKNRTRAYRERLRRSDIEEP